MKVTICCKYFSPRGGAQTFLFNFVRSLVADGDRVKVVTMEVEDPPEGVEVSLVPMPPVPKTFRDVAFARAALKVLEADDSDVSFGEQKCLGLDVVRPGGGVHKEYIRQIVKACPTAVGRAVRAITKMWSPKELLNYYIEKRLYRPPGPLCVIANSLMVRRHLVRHYPHLSDRIAVVYNGADCERYSPQLREKYRHVVRRELGIPEDGVVGAFVAFDWRRKGLRTVIEALSVLKPEKRARPVYCIVVGKGKRARAELFARGLGVSDRLRFVGVSSPDRYYGASDIVILPTYFDPCANVTVEGLACGLPVLTTIHNGGHELLTCGVNGLYMADPSDSPRLARFVEHFTDETRLNAASHAARECALRHTLKDMYRQIKDALVQVVEQKRRRGPQGALTG